MSATPTATSDAAPFPIVGIGASSGGLEAFTTFLENLPAATGMGFVILQHMESTRASALGQILSKATWMPVVEVTDGQRVEPNHVYIISPECELTIEKGVLRCEPRQNSRKSSMNLINEFFESLAQDQKEFAIGIILSGAGSDGTLGLEAIKAEGGITFAQDGSATHDSMPRSAIAAGCVDFILPPDAICKELEAIAKHPYMADYVSQRVATRDGDGNDEEYTASPETDGTHWQRIVQALRQHQGVDFTHYKLNTLHRRVKRRMILGKVHTMGRYAEMLINSRAELDALFTDLLIGVTSFFRNPESFHALGRHAKTVTQWHPVDEPLRVWIVGCSTGQEAYSVVMTLLESFDSTAEPRKLQVFATDLNEGALEKARQGFYSKAQVEDVSPARLRRFFVEGDGGYRINKALRAMCVFARHNFVADPPFSRIDVISCRNVLIYLNSTLQKKALSLFHYALRQHGLLFLGTSESVGGPTDLFEPFDKKHKIFSKNPVPTPRIGIHFGPAPSVMNRMPPPGQRPDPSPPGVNAQREADRVVLNRCAPSGLLLDDRLHVVQFRGDTSTFLKPPVGTATHNVLKMSREGLLQPLQAALQDARNRNSTVRTDNVQVHGPGGPVSFSLEVIPLKNTNEPYFLVLFDEGQLRPPERLGRDFSPENSEVATLMARVRELERELAEAQDATQALQENYEFVNEELQASNEEVQSANEELQSSNEELETSKEELESTNEELTTLNEEMSSRNADLNRLVNDLNNLHVSINTGIVLLSRDLTIRSFTPIAGRAFNLLTTDIGTPLNRIRHSINCPDLEETIEQVVESLAMQEREVQDAKGHWYSLRIRPYMTLDNRIDGAVLVMMDIDKQLEAVRLSETRYRRFFEAAQDGILIVDPVTHKVMEANPYVESLLDLPHNEVLGRELCDLGLFRDRKACMEAIAKVENLGVLRSESANIITSTGKKIHLEVICNLHKEGDHFVLQCNIRDITVRRQAEEMRIQLAAIVNSSQDAIFSKNLDGIVQSWNPAAEKLFGYTEAEMVGQSILKLIPSDLQPEEAILLTKLKQGERIDHYNTERLTKDGRRIPVRLTISPVRDADGVIVGASKAARDLTAQLRSEREHFEISQRLVALMNALPIGVSFSEDATCERITGNAAALEQFEMPNLENISASAPSPDAPGRKVRFFQKGREIPAEELPLQVAVKENRPVLPAEYEVLLPSGRRWILEATAAPVRDAEGKVIAGVSVTVDITDRKRVEEALKESEQRFRNMADAAPVLIWVSGLDKVCNYFNTAWLNFTGRTLEDEIDDGWKTSIHPDDKPRLVEIYEDAFDVRVPFESECRLLHHSGIYRWVLGRGTPRIGPDGTFNGYVGACVDIHDQKMATQAISLAHEAAELANRAKDQFLAALSHELRTPLSPVLLLCSEMEDSHDLPEKVREDFAMIRRNVELEARLIDDLLDITRITEGKLALNFEALHADTLIEQTLEILRGDIDSKHLTVELDLAKPEPAVKGDPVRLQQVLWNVLKNAVKFTPMNGNIRIRSQVEEGVLHVAVADTGMGITASEMPRIFNAFSQGDQAVESRFGGLGLGLSISALLMQEHHGRIWAESEGRGKGSVFHVTIPLASEQVAKGLESKPQPPPLPSLHVLLVEDHGASRDTLTRLLKRRGHQVSCADCIAAAHKLVKTEKFDIVISDLGLPDGSGHDLMFELRRDHQLRGIALSGYGTNADVRRSAEAGFLEHLTKPVDIRKLDAALARAFPAGSREA